MLVLSAYGKGLASPATRDTPPPNPVSLALEASAYCYSKAHLYTRDRRMANKLHTAASVLDGVACGLVEVANLAAEEADHPGQFNKWSTGKKKYFPRVVARLWLDGAIEFAGRSGVGAAGFEPAV